MGTIGFKASIIVSCPIFLFSILICLSDIYASRKDFILTFKKLFLEISDKPYEIRLNYEKHNKIKIVIEENLYSSNAHVIKEKSKHLTAYMDCSESHESMVKFLLELVEKSENTFK